MECSREADGPALVQVGRSWPPALALPSGPCPRRLPPVLWMTLLSLSHQPGGPLLSLCGQHFLSGLSQCHTQSPGPQKVCARPPSPPPSDARRGSLAGYPGCSQIIWSPCTSGVLRCVQNRMSSVSREGGTVGTQPSCWPGSDL